MAKIVGLIEFFVRRNGTLLFGREIWEIAIKHVCKSLADFSEEERKVLLWRGGKQVCVAGCRQVVHMLPPPLQARKDI